MGEAVVLQSGLFSTIQDRGRFGFLEYGVPLSGPMDQYSAGLANLILNNHKDCSVLELTQMGATLKFNGNTVIVVTGAHLSPKINTVLISNNVPYPIKQGDILSFGKREAGCRAYLAIAGGFQTEVVLGSRSWYEGITARASIKKGESLAYNTSELIRAGNTAVVKMKQDHLESPGIPVFRGPEFSLLSVPMQQELFKKEFTIDPNNNRMGIQLQEKIMISLTSMITGPVIPGTVQLTPGGNLIILMRDCQTTGGYPRVLQIADMGINQLSQKVTGDKIFFYDAGSKRFN